MKKSYCHNEKLHVLIDRVIKKCKYDFGMINAVAVGLGPGSYRPKDWFCIIKGNFIFSRYPTVIGVGLHETLLRVL